MSAASDHSPLCHRSACRVYQSPRTALEIACAMIRVPERSCSLLSLAFAVLAARLALASGDEWPGGSRRAVRSATAPIGGPFALIDQNGARAHDSDFRGRCMLLYFGYTHCPDVCPITLQDDGRSRWPKLGPTARRVVPIFITIDPERDTPEVLKNYVAGFGTEFVGLTGMRADITRGRA